MNIIVPDHPAFKTLEKHGADLLPYSPGDDQTFEHADGVLFLLDTPAKQRRRLLQTPGLAWVLTLTSGVNHLLPDLPAGVRLFNANPLHAHAVAVHVMAGLLGAARAMHLYRDQQREGRWARQPQQMHTLEGQTVALWGSGHIGQELEKMLQPFGAEVLTVTSRTEEIIWRGVRAEADHLVIMLPSTPQTRGSINADFLQAMKPGAWLHNIGRGDLVVTADMLAALNSGHLGGAVLDVTNPEPLPQEHPLWSMENVILTPHVGSATADLEQRAADYAGAVIQALLQGKQPEGEVDTVRGY